MEPFVNMSESETPTQAVGRQLAARRESLDLTQHAVASRIGTTVNSVSAAERGKVTIMRGRRGAWEQTLGLKTGTISRAYTSGSLIEVAGEVVPEAPYADLTDAHEKAVWEMNIPEEDRRTMIDILRSDRREQQGRSA